MQLAAAYISCFIYFLCSCDLQKVCGKSKVVFILHVKLGKFRDIHLFTLFTESYLFPERITELFRTISVFFLVIFYSAGRSLNDITGRTLGGIT